MLNRKIYSYVHISNSTHFLPRYYSIVLQELLSSLDKCKRHKRKMLSNNKEQSSYNIPFKIDYYETTSYRTITIPAYVAIPPIKQKHKDAKRIHKNKSNLLVIVLKL